jgi:hypothetical protein
MRVIGFLSIDYKVLVCMHDADFYYLTNVGNRQICICDYLVKVWV